jgi:hypothetical protein
VVDMRTILFPWNQNYQNQWLMQHCLFFITQIGGQIPKAITRPLGATLGRATRDNQAPHHRRP